MRIALAATSCDNVSGIGRCVRSLAAQFAGMGHETTVIAQHIDSLAPQVHAHVTRRLLWSSAANRLLFDFQSRGALASGPYDVTNAFGVGRGARVVTAQSCHKGGMEAMARFPRRRIRRRNLGFFDAVSLHDENFLSRHAERIIAVSRLVQSELCAYYDVSRANIRIVPNGVDLPLLAGPLDREEREALRQSYGADKGDFVLLFAGNEFDRKGLQTLIEAMAVVADRRLRLLVIGDDAKEPYLARAGAVGVRRQVTFLGRIAGPERLFGLADAFVLPTRYEPFGMVIIEAMAAGLPVITSAQAGAVEGMQDGVHALFLDDPLSTEALAEQLRRLCDDEQLRTSLAGAGRNRALEFSWPRIARETLAVYDEIVPRTFDLP